MAEALFFAPENALKLELHLPPPLPLSTATGAGHNDQLSGNDNKPTGRSRPFVTLTFAMSLDSSLTIAPGRPTELSGPQSKSMTHFLRSRHAAICVGVGTVVADDPSLNCRLASSLQGGGHQPRPIVIDPQCRWAISENSRVLQLARAGHGLAPFIVTAIWEPPADRRELLERHGGRYLFVEPTRESYGMPDGGPQFRWADVLAEVKRQGLDSIMIEGGGTIINSLLSPPDNSLIDSVIVTIAPTWLGQGGVVICPPRKTGADGSPPSPLRLADVSWHPLGADIVLCGKIPRSQ
ncbi:riboflavin biosynthesis protein [Diplogelasinospora grovesii]|uniref:2,5-diamino-6-ribosylamino-4(3H)-pyrimidinone 5'-phosphate reductase n=1 Tax=Diplogelasinospora grovesii TaxID=303347 RepID=A0AAN6MZS1_9PEZI|nr:riboflavin biosynthesis protein [Diplogelasinospora grovesii]